MITRARTPAFILGAAAGRRISQLAVAGFCIAQCARHPHTAAAEAESVTCVKTNFLAAESRHRTEPDDPEAGWQLGRATFDRADLATNSLERALFAEEGIAACEAVIGRQPKLAPAHYYLGMNLGQLARTKELSALKIVKRMEKEFIYARELDETFDFAGPDRNLGLLYREAPPVLSIGSRKEARQHLRRAVELAPQYPENRLNLAEAYIKWSEPASARNELKTLDLIWNSARTKLSGVAWYASWEDWEERRKKAAQKVGEPADGPGPPRSGQ